MRFARVYVSILIIYAAISGIVVSVSILTVSEVASGIVAHDAHLAPPSANIAFLHLTDCVLPCWIGIIPGKTTISEAQALIQHVYARKGFDIGAEQPDERYTFAITMRVHDQA